MPSQLEHCIVIARAEEGLTFFHEGWANRIAVPSQSDGLGNPVAWSAFILEMPLELDMQDLMEPVENGDLAAYVLENQSSENIDPVRYNAFLSQYWEPRVDHWMRIIAPANNHEMTCYLHNNFWGTDSTTLIDHAIWDYYDDFTSARIYYGTPPEHGYPSTYPFVERVLLNTIDSEMVPVFGAEPVTFQVIFNRDMDPNIQPFVTFGPAEPYTDFLIGPADNVGGVLGIDWCDSQ